MTAVLRAQPGTAHYVPLYGNQVKVAGIAGNVIAQAYARQRRLDRLRPDQRALVQRAG